MSKQNQTFNKNDYETPDKEARLMAKSVLPTDKKILEPFGGRGRIVKALLELNLSIEIIAHEINFERYLELKKLECNKFACGHVDFFGVDDLPSGFLYDLIMTNPPFNYAIKGIKHSLTLLNDKPESRLVFLLPLPFFSSQKRSKEFKELDCHIAEFSMIPWRIDYLKDGKRMSECQKEINGVLQFKKDGITPIMNSGSQEYHAVFTIKKGKKPDSNINFLA